MWPFSRKVRLEAVETAPDPLEDEVETLRRKVNALEYDVGELQDRLQRLSGRESKRRTRGDEPADGSSAAPTRRNGLPTLAQLRIAGRSPFGS